MLIAEMLGAERVILVKRTDGIYLYDPLRGFKLDTETGRCSDYSAWEAAQSGNERLDAVNIDDLLGYKISREGSSMTGIADGSRGHLMEDSALEFYRACENVKEIVVVPIAPEEFYHLDAEIGVYRHVPSGKVLLPEEKAIIECATDRMLTDRLRNAFNGIGPKITK
jgi:hypothetical protein